MTNNKTILAWIDEMKALVNPDQVVWIDGSEEQLEELRKEAVESGEMIKLNQEKLPGCYLSQNSCRMMLPVLRTEPSSAPSKEEDAGPTNHWKEPQEAYKMLYDIARGSYKGRTMYVIPYSMGPVGSPLAKIGVELTDSIYVVLNMSIMTRVGQEVMDVLGDSNDWVQRSALQVRRRPGEALYLPVPGRQHHHLRQLRLRRQRSARQEVLRSAHRFLSGLRTKAGWQSTCSSSALRTRRARLSTLPLHSRLLAARPTWPC